MSEDKLRCAMLEIATEARLDGIEFCAKMARELADVFTASASASDAAGDEKASHTFKASAGTLTFYADELASVVARKRAGR